MTMWIQNLQDCDPLKQFIRNSKIPIVVLKVNGEILWANGAFCEWSNYSLAELLKLNWTSFSADPNMGSSDVQQLNAADYSMVYAAQRQYTPRNETPCWGRFTAIRVPLGGPTEFCICTWEPAKLYSSDAFELAMHSAHKNQEMLSDLTKLVKDFVSRTQEEAWVMSTIDLAQKYPKITWFLVVVLLGLFGANNALGTLKQLKILPPDVVAVEK